MKKRIFAALLMMLFVIGVTYSGFAQNTGISTSVVTEDESAVFVKAASYNGEEQSITVTLGNRSDKQVALNLFEIELESVTKNILASDYGQSYQLPIEAGQDITIKTTFPINQYTQESELYPSIYTQIQYFAIPDEYIDIEGVYTNYELVTVEIPDLLNGSNVTAKQAVVNFLKQTGFSMIAQNWKVLIMLIIACVLLYLGIVKQFEPLLLVPIAFGMFLTNLPGAEMFHEGLFAGGHVHWDMIGAVNGATPGLLDYLYLGVKLGIYPCLIFMGVGAMTDFGPLIANPKSLLLGAAAQLGIFVTYIGAIELFGFTGAEAASTGIIGGADGPTAIFVTSKLAPHLLGPIAVAAYSYMALVPVIQPPIMKLLTTKKERQIVMKPLREVSKTEKIIFPIVVTGFVALLVPSATPLVGSLMLGNLARESGVMDRLSKTMQNELMNIVTIFLGITVGATATADTFLSFKTISIIIMGVVAFGMGTSGGVLLAKFMNLFLKTKINPLIGSAGVSAVPMAARVSQVVGQKENPKNFLLMHAMGPNVAGVIGSAIAAGVLIALFG